MSLNFVPRNPKNLIVAITLMMLPGSGCGFLSPKWREGGYYVEGFLLGPGYRQDGVGRTWQTGREIPQELYDEIEGIYQDQSRTSDTFISELQALYNEYGVMEEPYVSLHLEFSMGSQVYEWNPSNATFDDLLVIPDEIAPFRLETKKDEVSVELSNLLVPTADEAVFSLDEQDALNPDVWCTDARIDGGEGSCTYVSNLTNGQIVLAMVYEEKYL